MKLNFNWSPQLRLLLLLLMLGFNTITTAQVTNARVLFTPASPGFNTGVFQLTLPDSTGFSEIEIQLTETVEDSLIFSGVYLFNQTTGLPSGWSWQRTGTRITMGMGVLPDGAAWLGKVRAKTTSGNWGEWLVFLFN